MRRSVFWIHELARFHDAEAYPLHPAPVGTSGELARGFRSASLFSSPEKSLNFPDIGAVLIVSNDRTISDVAGGDGWSTASGTVGRISLPLLLAWNECLWNQPKIEPTKICPHCKKTWDNGEKRNTMGDKGKKDKEKGQKQNTEKQHQKDKKKADKQPKRNTWHKA
jgi:hypothetical protein